MFNAFGFLSLSANQSFLISRVCIHLNMMTLVDTLSALLPSFIRWIYLFDSYMFVYKYLHIKFDYSLYVLI